MEVLDCPTTEKPSRRHGSQPDHLGLMISYLREKLYQNYNERERFHVIFLSREHSFIDEMTFFDGNCQEISFRTRDLFSKALSVGSQAIILAHNHPSGDCRPSQADLRTTEKIRAISKALDIELADHLIFSRTAVYSMRAGGHL